MFEEVKQNLDTLESAVNNGEVLGLDDIIDSMYRLASCGSGMEVRSIKSFGYGLVNLTECLTEYVSRNKAALEDLDDSDVKEAAETIRCLSAELERSKQVITELKEKADETDRLEKERSEQLRTISELREKLDVSRSENDDLAEDAKSAVELISSAWESCRQEKDTEDILKKYGMTVSDKKIESAENLGQWFEGLGKTIGKLVELYAESYKMLLDLKSGCNE